VYGDQYKLDADAEWHTLPVDDMEIATGCVGSVDAFLHGIAQDEEPPVTARDAYATLAACIAADESAATGVVRVPDPEHFS